MNKKDNSIKISFRQVEDVKSWFFNYVQNFKQDTAACTENAILKENHTLRVCNEILSIGSCLELNANELHLAEITALFHDIGRFEQYARFKTFVDAKSVNHAMLGIEILEKNNVLGGFTASMQNLICRIISYHNRASLPAQETETCLFFARLLRDADKLDIWRVVTQYYQDKNFPRNEAIELDLPDTEEISENVFADLMNQRIVDFRQIKTLNDFKLLQIGWVFDVNFDQTFYALRSRRYIDKIKDALPDTTKIQEIFDRVEHYLIKKTNSAAGEK